MRLRTVLSLSLIAGAFVLGGCSSSREEGGSDEMTKNVGIYSPAPSPAWRPRVGISGFTAQNTENTAETAAVAADQLTTLAVSTDRFSVIERAQLDKILQEQGLAGVVKAGEVPPAGEIRGVDLLFIGKITNLRVKAEKSNSGWNLGSLGGYVGVFDINNSKSVISVECGVDIRLVNPANGEILDAVFSDYKRKDTLEAMNVGVLGYHNEAESSLKIDRDNQGKILRLAIDDAIKKLLPKLDPKLKARAPAPKP